MSDTTHEDNSLLMNTIRTVETTPRWAYTWCYFYMFAGIANALAALVTLLLLIITLGAKKGPNTGVFVIYSLGLSIQAITSMVMFWMCRSSLKSSADQA